MSFRVFVDGHVGTTGLRIRDWLAGRDDLALVTLPEEQRKDEAARRDAIRAADAAVLCLPDDAAREAAGWAAGAGTRIVDASTAHRVSDGWVYGLVELEPDRRDRIRKAERVSNPGCWPSGFLLAVRPLIDAGLLESSAPLSIHGLSGYTGGGRQMIEKWEDPESGLVALPFESPYALDRVHKHAPEMTVYSGLTDAPQFVPSVGPFPCGMRIEVPLPAGLRPAHASAKVIHEALAERYRGEPFVSVRPLSEQAPAGEHALDPRQCNDTNRMELLVQPHPSGHVLLVALLDNLGKGASGAAIQCLNLMLGLEETAGLPR
ncbi:MAG: N-acetyl-gamma-glutamyl-phosphate reductase [Myxococcota bacterium]|nr:N-acetyl-gamma-glutamyl-phosphate reductase [Myxococcota bacterium]